MRRQQQLKRRSRNSKMKKKSEKGMQNSISTIQNLNKISNAPGRFFSAVLLIIAGLSMMSFIQDAATTNNADSNFSRPEQTEVITQTQEACCLQSVTPGDEIKKTLITMPVSVKKVLVADAENTKVFIAEEKERRLYSMKLSAALKNADDEMHFNFQLSRLFPEENFVQSTDLIVMSEFIDEMVTRATLPLHHYSTLADTNIINNFMTEHFSISIAKSTIAADEELKQQFLLP